MAEPLVNRRLDGIQALRGIAAFIVVFFHLDIFLPGNAIANALFANGFKGVYIFFVVSGFIMAYTTRDSSNSPLTDAKNFMIKRCLRIIPLYYLTSVAVIMILHKWEFYLSERPDVLIKSLLFIPAFEPPRAPNYGDPPLLVGWTLNYEMMFYVLFAVGILNRKYKYHFLYLLFFVMIFIIPLLTFGTVTFDPQGYPFTSLFLRFLTNPIHLYFIAGVLIANFMYTVSLRARQVWMVFAIFSALFVMNYFGAFEFIGQPQADLFFITLLVGATSMLSSAESIARIPKWLVYSGDISYSVYLNHMIVILIVRGLLTKYGYIDNLSVWFVQLLCLAGTVAGSIVTYELIEKRMTSYIRTNLIFSRRQP